MLIRRFPECCWKVSVSISSPLMRWPSLLEPCTRLELARYDHFLITSRRVKTMRVDLTFYIRDGHGGSLFPQCTIAGTRGVG